MCALENSDTSDVFVSRCVKVVCQNPHDAKAIGIAKEGKKPFASRVIFDESWSLVPKMN